MFESFMVVGDKGTGPFGMAVPEVEFQLENSSSKIYFLCDLICIIVYASVIIVCQSL